MIDLFTNISAFSVLLAGIIGLLRYKSINRSFYPFLFLIWLAGANETLSYFLSSYGHYTPINNNVYVLMEVVLITLFFKRQELYKNQALIYYGIIALLILTWCTEAVLAGIT